MATTRLKWSSLLRISDLDFIPEAPKVLSVSDELSQVLSWLTGATAEDRRLLRCTEQGALLVADAWSLLNEVETDELYPEDGSPDSFVASLENKGVLVATSTQLVKLTFVRISGGASEDVYVSPDFMYWFPHSVYSITATVVPESGGTASYIGITTFS